MSSSETKQTSLGLLQLPCELLHRIVHLGSFESALALSCVCRSFHSICQPPSTYLAILENSNGLSRKDLAKFFCDGQRNELVYYRHAWLGRAGLYDRKDTAKLWAFASAQAIDLASKLDEHKSKRIANPEKIMTSFLYLPELVIASHPAVYYIKHHLETYLPLLLNLAGQSNSFDLQYRATFTAACTLMENRSKELSIEVIAGETALNKQGGDLCLLAQARTCTISDRLNTPLRLPRHPYRYTHHLQANLVVGRLVNNLNNQFLTGRMHRDPFEVAPPSEENIPLYELVKFSPPITNRQAKDAVLRVLSGDHSHNSTSSEILPVNHIPAMTSERFLTDGEWVGYYNYSRSRSTRGFDPMMHSINFHILENAALQQDERGIVSNTGVDGCGSFRLEGSINTTTGTVIMVKRYAHGTTWDWTAVMTPFGIVGSWGPAGWGGWLYLWKRVWAPRQ